MAASDQPNSVKKIILDELVTTEYLEETRSQEEHTTYGHSSNPPLRQRHHSSTHQNPAQQQSSWNILKFSLSARDSEKKSNYRSTTEPSTQRNTTQSESHYAAATRLEDGVGIHPNERDAELQDLKRWKVEHDQTVEKLRAELQREQEQSTQARLSAHHLQTILDNREFFLGPQISDDDMRTSFSSIFSAIKTWSYHFISGPKDALVDQRTDLLDKIQYILPWCSDHSQLKRYAASKGKPRLLVRGWAAYIACKRLLPADVAGETGKVDPWLDSASAQSFSILEQKISSTDEAKLPPRVLNDWRALTAELLSRSSEHFLELSSQPTIRDAAKEAMSLISPLAPPTKVQELEQSLSDIYREAVRFAQLSRRQRAVWSVRFPLKPPANLIGESWFMVDPSYMRNELDGGDEMLDEEALRHQFVEIAVTPALLKRGNANGEHYDRQLTAVPAGVIVYNR